MQKQTQLQVSDKAKAVQTQFFNPTVWEQMKGMANTFAQSGALPPDTNAARVLMSIQAGYEMGMKPIESIKSFYFVNGTINLYGAAVIRRLREHGWKIEYKDESGDSCTAIVSNDDENISDSFTFKEAEQSGWTKNKYGQLKPGWLAGANRRLKLRYGVISKIIKTYLPEVLGNATDIAEVAIDVAPLYAKETDALPTPKVVEEKKKVKKQTLEEKKIDNKPASTSEELLDQISQKRKGSKK